MDSEWKKKSNVTMSDRKHSDTSFTNEQTVRRRAWIEKAVDSVRGSISPGEEVVEARAKSRRPHLYIASSKRTR